MKIFFYVINKNKLDVSKTLFIDDSPQHIKTAKKKLASKRIT